MNNYLKWIFIGISSLIVICILIATIFLYMFYYEQKFTKESIHYYFLTENMQSKFIIKPKRKPIYKCQEHGNGGRICILRYESFLSKTKLEDYFKNIGYKSDNYGYLSDKANRVRIELSNDSSINITEIE